MGMMHGKEVTLKQKWESPPVLAALVVVVRARWLQSPSRQLLGGRIEWVTLVSTGTTRTTMFEKR